jgi:uncharacterized membrane protein (DUF373 family)
MVQAKIRAHFGDYLAHAEVAVYSILVVLLFIAALATIANADKMLWDGLHHWTIAAETLQVLAKLLVVPMLVEILHTVRISIRSHLLVTEPFLVVGLIASIRRILVITLEAANLTKTGPFSARGCWHMSRQHDRAGLAGLAHSHFGVFHNTLASVRAHPEEWPRRVNHLAPRTVHHVLGIRALNPRRSSNSRNNNRPPSGGNAGALQINFQRRA